jgi:hypothetical protein
MKIKFVSYFWLQEYIIIHETIVYISGHVVYNSNALGPLAADDDRRNITCMHFLLARSTFIEFAAAGVKEK